MRIPDPIAKAAKAILASAIAGSGTLAAAITGTEGFADVTAGEWTLVASVTLAAFGGVYGIRNRATS